MDIDPKPTDWHVIAEQASRETDPEKLLALTKKLSDILEAEQIEKRKPHKASESYPST